MRKVVKKKFKGAVKIVKSLQVAWKLFNNIILEAQEKR